MERKFITVQWRNSGDQITIGEAIAFMEATACFVEVNDGKDLTFGVEVA
ncbi:hypothetical protein [Natronincola ferrireducens]|uniref:Uncharacterized protein n=1 Tax=Natronincola ferrireducens TaxID=393762 RepID=A0A1G9H9Q7_9FIRM|nr:hypothetical protein [Natronincola ferrireducens]SDL09696.1 hypothetical protein SAMN05660472_02597 [Natronincola ferrireducens]